MDSEQLYNKDFITNGGFNLIIDNKLIIRDLKLMSNKKEPNKYWVSFPGKVGGAFKKNYIEFIDWELKSKILRLAVNEYLKLKKGYKVVYSIEQEVNLW